MTTRKTSEAKVTKKRRIHTYAELWRGSKVLLLLAREQAEQKGSYWLWMGSLILTAFSFEAYLNHIGPKIFKSWKGALERVPPKGKLDVVCEKLEIDLPKGKRPRKTVSWLFEFRNKLAHGRTETLEEKEALHHGDHYDLYEFLGKPPLTVWEKDCTEDNALRAQEDIQQVMELINEAMPENEPLFDFGMYEASASMQQSS